MADGPDLPEDLKVGVEGLVNESVGGCLSRYWVNWKAISRDPWVPDVLRNGYQIPFKTLPKLSPCPVAFNSYPPNSPQFLALQAEVTTMLEKGAIEKISPPFAPGFYARIFVVPKGDEGKEWRPVIDLTHLNLNVDVTPFKMETAKSVRQAIRPGDFFLSLDLKDAYFQIPMHPHSLVQISQVCLGGGGIPVQGPLFRPLHGTASVYQGVCCGGVIPPLPRYSSPEISGRLAYSSILSGGSHKTQKDSGRPLQSSRPSYKSEEILPHTRSRDYIPWYDIFLNSLLGLSQREENSKVSEVCDSFSVSLSNLQTIGDHVRPYGFSSGSHSRKSPSHEATTISLARNEASKDTSSFHCISEHRVPDGHSMVPVIESSSKRGFSGSLSAYTISGDRCLPQRVGVQDGPLHVFRTLDGKGVITAHKFARTKSNSSSFASKQTAYLEPDSSSNGRQHYSHGIYCPWGRHQIMGVFLGGQEGSSSSRIPEYHLNSPVHSGSSKCSGGFPLKTGPSSDRGVVSESTNLRSSMASVGSPTNRHFHNQLESEAGEVLLTSPRPSGSGGGCLSSGLVQQIPISVSPLQAPKESNNEDISLGEHTSDSHRSPLAPTAMVCGPLRPCNRATQTASKVDRPPDRKPRSKRVPPQRYFSLTRVEALQHLLREQGIQGHAAQVISECNRKSSLKLYESKWRVYVDWCKRGKVHPFAPSLPKLIDFFHFLRFSRKLSVSAIEGYRSSLNPIFKLACEDYTSSPALEMLFKSFKTTFDRDILKVPPWDVNVVLLALKDSPYEPAWYPPIAEFTRKTLFLISLATAHRVSEMAALSSQVGWASDGSVTLSFAQGFLAKNESYKHLINRTFKIPPLSSLTNDDNELLLCPVRALRHYLRLTKSNDRSDRLFVSPRDFSKSLSSNAISYFLRSTISKSFNSVTNHSRGFARVNAHKIRAVATSLRFKYNVNQVNIMKKAFWRSESVFCQRYLRNISHRYLNVHALGPLIVAQGVVQAGD